MSSESLIEAGNLGKVFHIYDRPDLRLRQFFLGWRKRYYREFWALRGVDFEVGRGETVGFMGRNGAGKSTLLQLVCGTLAPSEGQVTVRGRISALLELGSGFNPEFSGHDNVYLNGSLLGLSREEIDARYDRILTFADIGQFINLPVKTYSSGMMVRLAFSVAINIDPEILVVDEALAVGDARFTARCMTQLRKLQDQGVAILFVGHDLEAFARLCNRAYVLHDGRMVRQGDPRETVSWYLAFASTDFDQSRMQAFESGRVDADADGSPPDESPGPGTGGVAPTGSPAPPDTIGPSELLPEPAMRREELPEFKLFRHGDGTARIVSCVVRDETGRLTHSIEIGRRMLVEIVCEFYEDRMQHLVGFYIKDRLNLNVIGINTYQERVELPHVHRGDRYAYVFEFQADIRPGYYSVCPSIAYGQLEHKWMDYIENAELFRLVDPVRDRTVFGVCLPAHRTVRVIPRPAAVDEGASSPVEAECNPS
jgi:lipopolysaccharide transport system ATP-binding protein